MKKLILAIALFSSVLIISGEYSRPYFTSATIIQAQIAHGFLPIQLKANPGEQRLLSPSYLVCSQDISWDVTAQLWWPNTPWNCRRAMFRRLRMWWWKRHRPDFHWRLAWPREVEPFALLRLLPSTTVVLMSIVGSEHSGEKSKRAYFIPFFLCQRIQIAKGGEFGPPLLVG